MLSKFTEIGMYTIESIPDCEGKNAVLYHGDLWTNNIMINIDSEKRFTNDVAAIIDWQTMSTGAIGKDLSRLIVNTCSQDIRREIEVSYLPVYYEELKKKVSEKEGEFDMTLETFMTIYDFCMIDQSFHTIVMTGINLSKLEITTDEDNYLWDTRKFALASKSYFAIKDAIKRIKKHKPEWLLK
uniref:CHK domain-containing protein n=1 Tax=Parastrongyloides trichosuri TaxID=131310 RepID=A0A0N4ZDU6_PARTI